MSKILPSLESSNDTVLYAMDETFISVESNNRRSWSPLGHPPILEKNGLHGGLCAIGATEILKKFDCVVDVYTSKKALTSDDVRIFIERLLEINTGKKVYLLLDNAKIHTSIAMQNFLAEKSDSLVLMNFPRYSPDMNPQENIWNWLKLKLYKPKSRKSISELLEDTFEVYNELNFDLNQVRSLAYARNFLV